MAEKSPAEADRESPLLFGKMIFFSLPVRRPSHPGRTPSEYYRAYSQASVDELELEPLPSLEERRKEGDRWFLALVDPLLEKPAYFALKKENVTVGFVPGCDWVLPYEAMGLDVIGDSYRFDKTLNPSLHRAHDGEDTPERKPIGDRREKNPFFHLLFNQELSHWRWSDREQQRKGKLCWQAGCPEGHDCQLSTGRRMDERWPRMHCEENEASNDSTLRDGHVLKFKWPYWHYGGGDGPYCIHEIPPQSLRFVFIEELVNDEDATKDQVVLQQSKLGVLHLLHMPLEVLTNIASHIEPKEFFRTLGLASSVFTSRWLKKSIPWRSLTLYNSFDALRVPAMAAPGTAQKARCFKPWDKRQRNNIYARWKPLINHDQMVKLEIHDALLLATTGVPPKLKQLHLVVGEDFGEYWSHLKNLQFPATIKDLIVTCGNNCMDQRTTQPAYDSDDSDLDYEDGPEEDRLCPVWFFSSFRSVEKLHVLRVPFFDEKFVELSEENFENITELAVEGANEMFPLAKMKNLVRLNMSFALSVTDLDDFGLPGDAWRQLESVTVKNARCNFVDSIVPMLEKMPALKYLRLLEVDYGVCDSLPTAVPLLRILWARRGDVSLEDLAALVKNHKTLDAVTIVECEGSVKGVSRDDFPRGPGITVRWDTWKKGKTTTGPNAAVMFNFFFSRMPDAEYNELVEKYRFEPPKKLKSIYAYETGWRGKFPDLVEP